MSSLHTDRHIYTETDRHTDTTECVGSHTGEQKPISDCRVYVGVQDADPRWVACWLGGEDPNAPRPVSA